MEVLNAQGGAGSHARSLPRTHLLPQPSHTQKGKEMEKRGPPHNARRSTAIQFAPQERAMRTTHTRPQREGRSAPKSTTLHFTSLFPDKLELRPTAGRGEWRPTPTVRHGAHHPLPSECTQQAGAQSPSCHRNGDQKKSSSRTIDASSRKINKMRACQQHSQQRDTQRDN
ncbi:hypothetical protein TcCL_Unassigned02003 [Trypanosoma cruzi]|nr:hypothetical protein TcCL_Unassigned02003 [Trypanosoma cruzi]